MRRLRRRRTMPSTAIAAEGSRRGRRWQDLVAEARPTALDLGDDPGRVRRRRRSTSSSRCSTPGDTIIDGGNSWYHLDVDRAKELLAERHPLRRRRHQRRRAGLERGYCLMIGGDDIAVGRLEPIFDDARARVSTPRIARPGATATSPPRSKGWLHCGPTGAGHFVKMVHNGIEYGLMAAYAEGLNVLGQGEHRQRGPRRRRRDRAARRRGVLPVRHRPGERHRGLAPRIGRSPSGCSTSPPRRTSTTRSSTSTPATSATRARAAGRSTRRSTRACRLRCCPRRCSNGSRSRGRDDMANKVLSAMRAGFGGHQERKDSTRDESSRD